MGKTASKLEKIDAPYIPWVENLEKAILIAGYSKKPLMVMIWKSWCSTCTTVAPEYFKSEEFLLLSKYFVMVKSVDEKTIDQALAPDGSYVPRVMFLNSSGKLMEQFCNDNIACKNTRYFYPKAQDLVYTMQNVLRNFYRQNGSDNI